MYTMFHIDITSIIESYLLFLFFEGFSYGSGFQVDVINTVSLGVELRFLITTGCIGGLVSTVLILVDVVFCLQGSYKNINIETE